jgi:hypothetical protein
VERRAPVGLAAALERDEARSQIELLFVWAFSRLLVFLLATRHGSDVPFYRDVATRVFAGERPYIDFPLDHPPAALASMLLPAFVRFMDYDMAFRALLVACDLFVFVGLGRVARSISSEPGVLRNVQWMYVWIGAISFPFLLDRVDGVLVALILVAVLLGARGRMGWGYVVLLFCFGMNAGTWVLWGPWLLADVRSRKSWRGPLARFAIAAGTLILVAAVGIAWLGPGLSAPLTYHWLHGTEVESVAASPFLVAHVMGAAQQVDGSTGTLRLQLSPGMQQASLLLRAILLACFWFFVFRRFRWHDSGGESTARVAWLATGIVVHLLLFQLLSSVLLPQYIGWAAPLACALIVVARPAQRWRALWLGVMAMTVAVFPMQAVQLERLESTAVWTLLLRNTILVILFIWSCRLWMTHDTRIDNIPRRQPG